MPTPALLLTIAALLPLASFVLLVFAGKRLGNPLAGWVGAATIASSFACSLVAATLWLNGAPSGEWGAGVRPIDRTYAWVPVGQGLHQNTPGYLDVGVYVDSLTIAMFLMVTLISTLIFIFSIGYMHEDKRFARFFTYLCLFCFSMLGLVLGGTLLQLFIFWELVGLCSYLLIGFWYEKKSASNAAIKAFVTNRVGDFGFLIGFGILFYHVGNATLPHLWTLLGGAGTGAAVTLPGGVVFSASLLTVMGIGLFFGAVGKSAQFPLHVWLPDAMEGPTPVSALIHAATMVAAGVYLVGRIFPILTPGAKLFVAIIGVTTLTMAALIAIVQSDIKRVLAYSTLSQLGYMILAMGVGSWVGGLFHLITHAFFKALLFLGSGSVIHAAHHEQEMPQYGGLARKIPVTAVTFGIAVLAIAGMPFLSGYYSKDLILAQAGAFAHYAIHEEHRSTFYALFFYLPTFIAYITAFYMTRCWMLTFWGKPRNQHLHDHAHEQPILYLPLIVLAFMSIIAGYQLLGVKQLLTNAQTESNLYSQELRRQFKDPVLVTEPAEDAFARSWPGEEPQEIVDGRKVELTVSQEAHVHGWHAMHSMMVYGWGFLISMGLGVLMYWRGYTVADRLVAIPPLRWLHTWLYRRMYFDDLYHWTFISLTLGLSKLSGWFDQYVVDGVVNLVGWLVERTSALAGLNDQYLVDGAVNGAAEVAQGLGAAVRAPQTGRIRLYVTILMLALSVGLAAAIVGWTLFW